MQCFHPIHVRDPSKPDIRDKYGASIYPDITVPCGKCFACQSNRRREWQMRCKYELKHSVCSYTVTLTYDNDHIPSPVPFYLDDPIEPNARKFYYHPYRIKDLQDFNKRLRHEFNFRFFGVAEYGGKTARPHFHVIYFFDSIVFKDDFLRKVYKLWPHGVQVVVDQTDDRCIGYTTKYCVKMYNHKGPDPHILCSRRPGIGISYLQDSTLTYLGYHRGDFVNTLYGRMRLPRYYRDKVYDDISKQLNKNYLGDLIDELEAKEIKEADDRGLDLDVLRTNQRNSFVNKCIKLIKNSKI